MAAAAAVVAGAGAGPRQDGGKVRAAPSLRQAREERRAASEEIRVLQQRKADAAVRLQGEKLRCLFIHTGADAPPPASIPFSIPAASSSSAPAPPDLRVRLFIRFWPWGCYLPCMAGDGGVGA